MDESTPESSKLMDTSASIPAQSFPVEIHPDLMNHDSALSVSFPTPYEESTDDHIIESYEDSDDRFNDNDSAFGGSLIGCDTDTLASFITDYRYENGRRYHAYRDGEYWVY